VRRRAELKVLRIRQFPIFQSRFRRIIRQRTRSWHFEEGLLPAERFPRFFLVMSLIMKVTTIIR